MDEIRKRLNQTSTNKGKITSSRHHAMTVHEDSGDTNALILGLGNQIVRGQLHAQAALTLGIQQSESTEEDAERAAEPVGMLWREAKISRLVHTGYPSTTTQTSSPYTSHGKPP